MINSVLNIIEQHSDGISEFELMKRLDAQGFFDSQPMGYKESNGDDLILFHKHFMLMHTLYRLQDELSLIDKILIVSPLGIKLIEKNITGFEKNKFRDSLSTTLENSENSRLKEYYLNWENYSETTSDNVKNMLNSFWRKLLDPDSRLKAFKLFDLPLTASQEEIKKRYRQLAALHHPDKGGEEEKFIEIQSAFEVLNAS